MARAAEEAAWMVNPFKASLFESIPSGRSGGRWAKWRGATPKRGDPSRLESVLVIPIAWTDFNGDRLLQPLCPRLQRFRGNANPRWTSPTLEPAVATDKKAGPFMLTYPSHEFLASLPVELFPCEPHEADGAIRKVTSEPAERLEDHRAPRGVV